MFKRKIYNDMIAWKESLKVKKKALVIRGARQIGKTTIAIKFAEEFYKNYVYINFKDNDNLKKIFDKDLIILEASTPKNSLNALILLILGVLINLFSFISPL